MPLSLSVKLGDRILVGNQKIEIVEIEPTVRVRVRAPSGKIITITDLSDVELMPKVKLGLGKYQSGSAAKLVFLVPNDVPILREDLLTGGHVPPSMRGDDGL